MKLDRIEHIVKYKEEPKKFLRILGHELLGVIADVENNGFDDVCLKTVRRVENSLGRAAQGHDAETKYFTYRG